MSNPKVTEEVRQAVVTDDVRAAVERVRRWRAGEWLAGIYPDTNDRAGELACLETDWRDVSVAYLNAFPADDGEPVTEEWLLAAGFTVNPLRDRLEVGPAQWWHFANCVLGIDHHTGFWTLPTRGHVRRLCAALGIPLTETPK